MKIERKKLILIIAIIITAVLSGLVIALSMITRPTDTPPSPSPTSITPTDSNPSSNPLDNIPDVVVGEPDSTDAPPTNIYENNFSDDIGYAPLPDSYKTSTDPNPTGTVLDETWAMERYHTLVCELSTKESVTQEALKPIKAFTKDLTMAKYQNASAMRAGMTRWVEAYEIEMGNRAPGSTQSELILECQTITDGIEDNHVDQ